MWNYRLRHEQITDIREIVGRIQFEKDLISREVEALVVKTGDHLESKVNHFEVGAFFRGNDGKLYVMPTNEAFFLAFGERDLPVGPTDSYNFPGYPVMILKVGEVKGESIVIQVVFCSRRDLLTRRKVIGREISIQTASDVAQFDGKIWRSRVNLFELDSVFEDSFGRRYIVPSSNDLFYFFGRENLPMTQGLRLSYVAGKEYVLFVGELNGESMAYMIDEIPPSKTHEEAVIWDPAAKPKQNEQA